MEILPWVMELITTTMNESTSGQISTYTQGNAPFSMQTALTVTIKAVDKQIAIVQRQPSQVVWLIIGGTKDRGPYAEWRNRRLADRRNLGHGPRLWVTMAQTELKPSYPEYRTRRWLQTFCVKFADFFWIYSCALARTSKYLFKVFKLNLGL